LFESFHFLTGCSAAPPQIDRESGFSFWRYCDSFILGST
jgi:starvation-inducible outer membrane lipoprotein